MILWQDKHGEDLENGFDVALVIDVTLQSGEILERDTILYEIVPFPASPTTMPDNSERFLQVEGYSEKLKERVVVPCDKVEILNLVKGEIHIR